jgi:membrane protein
MILKDTFLVFKDAAANFAKDKGFALGAAMAFYAILSLAPLITIAIVVIGVTGYGPQHIAREVEALAGARARAAVEMVIDSVRYQTLSVSISTVVSVATLLVGSLMAFKHLQKSMNMIWGVRAKPTRGILGWLYRRFVSLAMVLVIGFLLLLSPAVSATIAAIVYADSWAAQVVDLAVSLAIFFLLFVIIFKVLPDVRIALRDACLGAAATAVLFAIGEQVIRLYLRHTPAAFAYGAAGSLVILLLWIYYVSIIVFFGAELTRVYTERYGRGMSPQLHAVRILPRPPRPGARRDGRQRGSRPSPPVSRPPAGPPFRR